LSEEKILAISNLEDVLKRKKLELEIVQTDLEILKAKRELKKLEDIEKSEEGAEG